jgi:hypothetical protein
MVETYVAAVCKQIVVREGVRAWLAFEFLIGTATGCVRI